MNYKKGDLILVNSLEDYPLTCIIVGIFTGSKYVYCYCIEDTLYRLIYYKEIECILSEDFAPDFPKENFFDIDYSFYSACFDAYSYFPSLMDYDDDDDTEEK